MAEQLTEAQALEILQSRASTYGFLSLVYRKEVTVSFLAELIEQLAAEPDEAAESEGYRTLRKFVQQIKGTDLEKVRTELAAVYAALFLNMGPNPVFPFESVYTSSEGLLMQRARDEVLAEYRKEGLARISDFNEPEDHVAIELEFMGYLCQKSAEALEAGDRDTAEKYLQKQKDFLERHLLAWIPQFCKDVAKATRSGFYKGIAQITEEHLSLEGETIAELMAAV
jgi:TorA maturation chaperone TorD